MTKKTAGLKKICTEFTTNASSFLSVSFGRILNWREYRAHYGQQVRANTVGSYGGKAIPLQNWTGPEGSRRLRLQHFKTTGT
jgi:hypothetical protein